MCEAVGLQVARLKRISIGPVKLGMLQTGKTRRLTDNEVHKLLRSSNPATQEDNN
jgi:23S rRNA pseudouridine2605 synthase